VDDLLAFSFFRLPRGVPQRLSGSSDISGNHSDCHEGQGAVEEWQGRGMAWQGYGIGAALHV
jgi:hypothetical protein